MDPSSPTEILLARLDGQIARLAEAVKAVTAEGQNSRLKKRIGDDLARRLSAHAEALRQRRNKIAASGNAGKNVWSEVKSSTSASLLDECLLYLQAARSRSIDGVGDLCEITDVLFEEIAGKAKNLPWESFSVFAAGDSFDVLKQIVRVRFPLSGVWDIPVAVHEFGHFLAGQLRHQAADGSSYLAFQEHKRSFVAPQTAEQTGPDGQPANPAAQSPASGIDWRAWLDEIFADVFATFAAGPAFACSSLLFRFDPSSAQEKSDTHPPFCMRAHVILGTLRRCNNEGPQKGNLGPIIEILASSWSSACKAAGRLAEIAEVDRVWIDGQISNLYDMLKADAGGLRFGQWQDAQEKSSWLVKIPQETPEFTLLELLNAAWFARLSPNSKPDALNDNFIKLARRKTESYAKP